MDEKPPIRLVFFNHKGGVGKTTMTVNVATEMAKLKRTVLLVDSDPQTNLTSYIVSPEYVDLMLDESDTPKGRTIWSAVQPVVEGTGSVRAVEPIESSYPGLYLIPGDIKLAEFEEELVDFWRQSLERKPKGYRGLTAISTAVGEVANSKKCEFIIYDAGPNVGALNRAILLDCDFFIIPMACDLFSLRALSTLGRSLSDWVTSWQTIEEIAPESAPLLQGHPRFLGFVPGQFRVYGRTMVRSAAEFMPLIHDRIHSEILAVLRKVDSTLLLGEKSAEKYELGRIKDFGSLASAAQMQGKPVADVEAGTPAQREEVGLLFSELAKRIIADIEGAAP